MPTIESTQHKLDRVRPPRVQITYDVQTGDAIEKVELPFVMGILADLAGATENETPVKERKFVEIDRDNFNHVMRSIKPTLTLPDVPKTIPGDDGNPPNGENLTSVSLTFTKMDDFKPVNVVKQIPDLNKLLEERNKLRDLLAILDSKFIHYDEIQKFINNNGKK